MNKEEFVLEGEANNFTMRVRYSTMKKAYFTFTTKLVIL